MNLTMIFYLILIAYVVIVIIIPLSQAYLLKEGQKENSNPGNNFYYRLKRIQIHHANFGWHIILSIILFLSTILTIGHSSGIIIFFTNLILIPATVFTHIYYWFQAIHYSTSLIPPSNKSKAQENQVNQFDNPLRDEDLRFRLRVPLVIALMLFWVIFGVYIAIPDAGNDFEVKAFFIYSIFMIIAIMMSTRPSGKGGWFIVCIQIIALIIVSYLALVFIGGGR